MRARLILVAVVTTVLMTPGAAHAKGPDQATIDGVGMPAPVSIDGIEGSNDDLGTLADLSGLWPATYAQRPDPMLPAAPTEDLGPKLVITWRVPDGGPTPGSVRQELYLYAEGGPLTYTAPDQPVLGSERTAGGWFRTPTALQPSWETFALPDRTTLEAAARPATSPASPASERGDGPPLLPWVVVAFAAALGASAVIASRVTFARRVRVGST
jgi:hypothetical protein